MAKILNRALQLGTDIVYIGTTGYAVTLQDPNSNVLSFSGLASQLPAAGLPGIAAGATYTASDSGAQYINLGTSASCNMQLVDGAGTLLTKTVALTAAQLISMYTTPIVVIPAVTGKKIYVDTVDFDIVRTATAFTGGGVVDVQIDSTANGAGTIVHADIAAAVVTGSAGTSHTHRTSSDLSDIADASLTGKGLYISNKTAPFAAGTGTASVTVRYYYY